MKRKASATLVIGVAALIVVLISSGILMSLFIEIDLGGGSNGLPKYSSCNQLAASIAVSNLDDAGSGFFREMTTMDGAFGSPMMATAQSGAKSSDGAVNSDFSGTNVQVQGVDESDIVKTDGSYIYTVSLQENYYGYYESGRSVDAGKDRIIIAKAIPVSDAAVVSTIEFDNFSPDEMFIEGDRLLVIGSSQLTYDSDGNKDYGIESEPYFPYGQSVTTVKIFDISDRANPKMARTVDFEGYYISSRKIGTDAYLVLNSYLDYYRILEDGQVSISAVESLIPAYRDTSGSGDFEPTCGCADIAYLPPVRPESFMTLASISMADDDAPITKETMLGSGQNIYASTNSIYVAETSWPSWGFLSNLVVDNEPVNNFIETTTVYKFSLDAGKITYQGDADVPGHILNQFSMDEYEGNFRIATTVGRLTRSGSATSNNVYVLNSDLVKVGEIEDIAPGESIYSARFMGDRAYLVTFKKIDPFFVIDLSEPTNPTILGKLKIPGYSDYLHPYDDNHIIGIGKDTVPGDDESGMGSDFSWYQGVKMAIFDVTDVSNPVEMHKIVIGDRGTSSEALETHKAFLFDKEKGLLVIPISLAHIEDKENADKWSSGDYIYQGAYVYDIGLENGFDLKGRITHYDLEGEDSDVFVKSGYYFNGKKNVKRTLYIGDTLYTISNTMIKANSLSDLAELAVLDFGA